MKKGISAEKRIRQSRKKEARNKVTKSFTKGAFKDANLAVGEKSPDVGKLVLKAVKAADKAAQKGIIHPNKAARKKSRLMKKYNRLEKKEEA